MLVTGIGELVTNDPTVGDGSSLGILRNAALVVDSDGMLAWLGSAAEAPAADECVDVAGRVVIPGFVDSHTHLVFAGDRANEFAARMSGTPYDGGGITTTVAATAAASETTLRTLLADRIAELRAQGTTTVEIKSGYGLSVAGEELALRLAGEFTTESTFLGAHVVPAGMARDDYIRLVTGAMLAACAPFARWIDVFCEPASPHAFDGDEAREVLTAGAAAGLGLRVHGNQLAHGPGVRLAVELGAASVDHCTWLTAVDIDALAGGTTVATLLPGVEWSTRSPYPNARRMIDAGVTIALATDFNPGTCATSSMPLMIALAVREMGMTTAEALWAATAGGSAALRRDDIGVLSPGRRADLAVIDAPSYLHLAYRPGAPLVSTFHLSPSRAGI
ncbi:MAG TPA: imidazolonepropionase [Acidimicrobiales bacterium]|nr:imidazolonepropionase [Acidimicrobiales bacterium]